MDEQTIETSIKELEKENLSLKFSAVHKDLQTLREELDKHLRLILEQTSKTNGSVAKVIQQIHEIEHKERDSEKEFESVKVELSELKKEFVNYKKNTQFWYILHTNKWLAIPIILALYALTLKEVRDLIISLLK